MGKLLFTDEIYGYDNITVTQNINSLKAGKYFVSVLLNNGSLMSTSFIKL